MHYENTLYVSLRSKTIDSLAEMYKTISYWFVHRRIIFWIASANRLHYFSFLTVNQIVNDFDCWKLQVIKFVIAYYVYTKSACKQRENMTYCNKPFTFGFYNLTSKALRHRLERKPRMAWLAARV